MMTEMDAHTRRELEELRVEREELQELIATRRKEILAKSVATVREMYSRGYGDPQIARELGVTPKVVTTWRVHGVSVPSGNVRKGETPALDSAGKRAGQPLKTEESPGSRPS